MPSAFDESLLTAYLDGELERTEAVRVHDLLQQRPDLMREYQQLRVVRDLVASLPERELADSLQIGVLDRIETTTHNDRTSLRKRPLLSKTWGRVVTGSVLMATAASLLFAIYLQFILPAERGDADLEIARIAEEPKAPMEADLAAPIDGIEQATAGVGTYESYESVATPDLARQTGLDEDLDLAEKGTEADAADQDGSNEFFERELMQRSVTRSEDFFNDPAAEPPLVAESMSNGLGGGSRVQDEERKQAGLALQTTFGDAVETYPLRNIAVIDNLNDLKQLDSIFNDLDEVVDAAPVPLFRSPIVPLEQPDPQEAHADESAGRRRRFAVALIVETKNLDDVQARMRNSFERVVDLTMTKPEIRDQITLPDDEQVFYGLNSPVASQVEALVSKGEFDQIWAYLKDVSDGMPPPEVGLLGAAMPLTPAPSHPERLGSAHLSRSRGAPPQDQRGRQSTPPASELETREPASEGPVESTSRGESSPMELIFTPDDAPESADFRRDRGRSALGKPRDPSKTVLIIWLVGSIDEVPGRVQSNELDPSAEEPADSPDTTAPTPDESTPGEPDSNDPPSRR